MSVVMYGRLWRRLSKPNLEKCLREVVVAYGKEGDETTGMPPNLETISQFKTQQKEAQVGFYIVKQAFIFAKYPIMGQVLYCGVARMGLPKELVWQS